MKLRLYSVCLVALAAFAIQAGAALASTATFVAPLAGATISENTSFVVDTTGLTGVAGVDIFTNDTGDQSLTQYDGGWSNSIIANHGQSVDLGNGLFRVDLGIAGWMNPLTNDSTPYSLTFVAVPVDSAGAHLDAVSETLTIDNTLHALTITSLAPSADSTVSGTFTLTVHAADQNEITDGTYSLNGDSPQALTQQSAGVFTASIDTTAIANGDLYVVVDLNDEPGNSADNGSDQLHLVVQNAVAPTIVSDTLVAEKSLYRTDETQLEVGDIVTAYNMEADGFPAPAISYLWNICRGQVCTGVTPGPSGDYTIQAADEGATLTLIATATNASGSDFTTVDFGVIAPAFVDVYYPYLEPTPEPAPAPVAVAVAPAPAAVLSVPAVTPAAQKAIADAQQAVSTMTVLVDRAEQAKQAAVQTAKAAEKKVGSAVNAVAPNATKPQKAKLVAAVQTLVVTKAAVAEKVTAAKAVVKKAVAAKTEAVSTVTAAQSRVAAAQKAVASGTATKAEKTQLASTKQKLVAAKSAASAKVAAAAAATAKAAVVQQGAAKSVAAAKTKVDTVVNTVSNGTATPSEKTALVSSVTTLVTAKSAVAEKTSAAAKAAAKLAVAKKTLAATTNP